MEQEHRNKTMNKTGEERQRSNTDGSARVEKKRKLKYNVE